MNQEMLKRLDALAAKLGTTATYLWSVMVRQAVATGYADAGVAALFLCVGVGCAFLLRFFIRAEKSEKYHYGDWPLVCGVISGLAIVACIGIVIGFSYAAFLELACPQGWALQHILGGQ